jgi:hypothetical protein
MSIRAKRTARWIAALVGLPGMAACASTPPFVVALPNGYYLQRDRNAQVALVQRGGRTIIQGPIAAYGVSGELVAGCVGESPKRSFSYPNDTPFPDSPDCRYFILDTPSGHIESGLDPQAWRAKLKAIGAPQSLPITAPVLPM